MKKFLIAILAVAALANANTCDEIALLSINRLRNCELAENDNSDILFQCSNGRVTIRDKNLNSRRLIITNANGTETLLIAQTDCYIHNTDEYGVLDDKLMYTDSDTMSRVWNYFKRSKVR